MGRYCTKRKIQAYTVDTCIHYRPSWLLMLSSLFFLLLFLFLPFLFLPPPSLPPPPPSSPLLFQSLFISLPPWLLLQPFLASMLLCISLKTSLLFRNGILYARPRPHNDLGVSPPSQHPSSNHFAILALFPPKNVSVSSSVSLFLSLPLCLCLCLCLCLSLSLSLYLFFLTTTPILSLHINNCAYMQQHTSAYLFMQAELVTQKRSCKSF